MSKEREEIKTALRKNEDKQRWGGRKTRKKTERER
jgi:hypothetical protein